MTAAVPHPIVNVMPWIPVVQMKMIPPETLCHPEATYGSGKYQSIIHQHTPVEAKLTKA